MLRLGSFRRRRQSALGPVVRGGGVVNVAESCRFGLSVNGSVVSFGARLTRTTTASVVWRHVQHLNTCADYRLDSMEAAKAPRMKTHTHAN